MDDWSGWLQEFLGVEPNLDFSMPKERHMGVCYSVATVEEICVLLFLVRVTRLLREYREC